MTASSAPRHDHIPRRGILRPPRQISTLWWHAHVPGEETMTAFPTVRVAAVQATPVILDAEASVAKAVGLLGDVAEAGARLAVLPETFVSLYPSNAWAAAASGMDGASGLDELWERMWASSIDVPGPLVDELIEACRRHDVVCAIG